MLCLFLYSCLCNPRMAEMLTCSGCSASSTRTQEKEQGNGRGRVEREGAGERKGVGERKKKERGWS